MVHGVGADLLPRLDRSLHRPLRHLVPLKVDKDGIVGAPGPAQADQVLTRDGGIVVAFPRGRERGEGRSARRRPGWTLVAHVWVLPLEPGRGEDLGAGRGRRGGESESSSDVAQPRLKLGLKSQRLVTSHPH